MSELVDNWKLLLMGSSLVLLYQLYRDFKRPSKTSSKQRQIKICITGGPCSGKTQGMAEVASLFSKRGIPTFIVPEAATILGSGGGLLSFNDYDDRQVVNFQYFLMRLQMGLEDTMSRIANIKCTQVPIILCDRGLLDGKAYMGESLWNQMLKNYHMNEDRMLTRYDLVVHLVTVADGVPELFQKNKTKGENAEEAILVDKQIQKSWQKHTNRYIITNQFLKTFDEKKSFLATYIYQNLLPRLNVDKLRKNIKSVNEGYYSYIDRKQKLKKRQQNKMSRKQNA